MGLLVTENNKIVSFKNYILSEAIKPKETTFGTNEESDNNKFLKSDNIVYTFFSDKEKSYLVALDVISGDLGFSSKDGNKISLNPQDYSVSRKDTLNALVVFNKVFYIVLKIAEKYKPQSIVFDAANPALGSVYDIMVKNKSFNQELNNVGFEFSEKIGTTYVFKKVSP